MSFRIPGRQGKAVDLYHTIPPINTPPSTIIFLSSFKSPVTEEQTLKPKQ